MCHREAATEREGHLYLRRSGKGRNSCDDDDDDEDDDDGPRETPSPEKTPEGGKRQQTHTQPRNN